MGKFLGDFKKWKVIHRCVLLDKRFSVKIDYGWIDICQKIVFP